MANLILIEKNDWLTIFKTKKSLSNLKRLRSMNLRRMWLPKKRLSRTMKSKELRPKMNLQRRESNRYINFSNPIMMNALYECLKLLLLALWERLRRTHLTSSCILDHKTDFSLPAKELKLRISQERMLSCI